MGESGRPRTAFVSGCYDILHAGHVQFFTEARALADRLVVSFASAEGGHWRSATRVRRRLNCLA